LKDNNLLNVSLGYDDIYLFRIDNIEREYAGDLVRLIDEA